MVQGLWRKQDVGSSNGRPRRGPQAQHGDGPGHRAGLLAPLAVGVALLAGSGCAQTTGSVRGETVVDLFPQTTPAADCAATVVVRDDASLRTLEAIGELTIEGPIWMVREDIEDIARVRACQHGASHVVLRRERIGTPLLGSSAEAVLYAEGRAAPPRDG